MSDGTKYVRHLMFFVLSMGCVCTVFEEIYMIQLACTILNWALFIKGLKIAALIVQRRVTVHHGGRLKALQMFVP